MSQPAATIADMNPVHRNPRASISNAEASLRKRGSLTSGIGAEGGIRIVERTDHPCFVSTLFSSAASFNVLWPTPGHLGLYGGDQAPGRMRVASPYGKRVPDCSAHGVYLITGAPGSGKTTVSQALAKRFQKSAHLEGDLIGELVIAGRLYPDQEPIEESRRQLELRRRNLCLLADSYFAAGFVPIIDDVVVTPDVLRLFQTDLRSRPLWFVVLAPRLDILRKRDARRDKHLLEVWGYLDSVLRQQMAEIGLWIDLSDMTIEETVEAILAGAETGVLA